MCLSADHRGSCVGVEAVEIPSFIVVCVCACVSVCVVVVIWLLNAVSLGPSEAVREHKRAVNQVFAGRRLTCSFPSFKNKQGWGGGEY